MKTLVEENGGSAVNVRSGLDKFGSRWALVNMETKAGGEAVIRGLDEMEIKGREIFVNGKTRECGFALIPVAEQRISLEMTTATVVSSHFPK